MASPQERIQTVLRYQGITREDIIKRLVLAQPTGRTPVYDEAAVRFHVSTVAAMLELMMEKQT